MRVTLIHNPRAGAERVPTSDEMVQQIRGLDWEVDVVEKDELDRGLEDPGNAVLVAGGDGTVGKVAKRLAGTEIPLGVIPTGTANNVARTLGVGVDPASAIELLRRAVVRDVDLGRVFDGTGEGERFLEGFGVGLFAQVMAERATRKHKKLRRAFELLADELEAYEPRRARIEADGVEVGGEYLLASVMNLRSMGPALGFAPNARIDDGMLDLVLVRPEHRETLLAHLKRAAAEGDVALPLFEVHRAAHVRLSGHGRWAHVDDCAREFPGDVEVRVEPRVVKFLAPPPVAGE